MVQNYVCTVTWILMHMNNLVLEEFHCTEAYFTFRFSSHYAHVFWLNVMEYTFFCFIHFLHITAY